MNESPPASSNQTEVQPIEPPTPPPPEPVVPLAKPTRNNFGIMAAVLAIGLLLGLVIYLKQPSQPPEPLTPQPTPTIAEMPTPTPIRPLSQLATASAFLTFEQNVASLSAYLDVFPIREAAFTPPSFELDLGLTD